MSREPGAREAVVRLPEVPVSICAHRTPADWLLQSTHPTSSGTVSYFRCACGAWLVLLDGQRLAAPGHSRGALSSKLRFGDRSSSRRRRGAWLDSHLHSVSKNAKDDADNSGSWPDRGRAAISPAAADSDPFDRMLLTDDGTVTSLLEACTGEPIATAATGEAGPP